MILKKAEVLSVGTELLMGQVANTNAQYISKRLPETGVGVYYHSVVGDNPKRLEESLKLSLSRSDIVILTGGLGPTQDDLTKETVSKTLGLTLVRDDDTVAKLEEYFRVKGRVMTESNYKQAMFPEGSIIIKNNRGTAPGCIIEWQDRVIMMLPGPPRELIPMVDEGVMPYLRERTGIFLKSIFLRTIGIGESNLEKEIIKLVEGRTNPTVATYVKDGIVTVRITASAEDEQEAERLARETEKEICDILGDAVFTLKDEEIYETVFNMLKEKKLKISSAESFTGGLFSQLLTSVPGSSEVFEESVVTYSNKAKISLLGVSPETIAAKGVVSSETALEMARGVVKLTGADIGVSFTGFAGPDGGEGRPRGNVFVAVVYKDREEVREFNFPGERNHVRMLGAVNAFNMVRKIIN